MKRNDEPLEFQRKPTFLALDPLVSKINYGPKVLGASFCEGVISRANFSRFISEPFEVVVCQNERHSSVLRERQEKSRKKIAKMYASCRDVPIIIWKFLYLLFTHFLEASARKYFYFIKLEPSKMGNSLSYTPYTYRPRHRVLLYGLPGSGKSTLVARLTGQHPPLGATVGVRHTDVVFGQHKCSVMDIGLCDYISYKDHGSVVVYMVGEDALDQVSMHFHSIASESPLLIVVNKQDLIDRAHSVADVTRALGDIARPHKAIPCVIRDGIGVRAVRDWVTKYLDNPPEPK